MNKNLKKLTFSIDKEKAEMLEKIAKDNYTSLSASVRKALDAFYFSEENKKMTDTIIKELTGNGGGK